MGRRGGPASVVRRDKIVGELGKGGREAGVIIICAPDGFGKTSVLLQYASTVSNDPARGGAALRRVEGRSLEQIVSELDRISGRMDASLRPLIALDDLPRLKGDQAAELCEHLRDLRSRGFEVVVTCTPARTEFLSQMGDAMRMGAQALRVQPSEYHDWAATFSIASGLDAYRLTQGVPELVSLLQQAGPNGPADTLDIAIQGLYGHVLEGLRMERDVLYRVVCLFILMGRGSIGDFERCGMRIRSDSLTRLVRDYPVFGFENDGRTFTCLGTDGSASLAPLRAGIASRRRDFAVRAVRTLLAAGEVDRAVTLAEELLSPEEKLSIIDQRPIGVVMGGHAGFVRRALLAAGEARASSCGAGLLVAMLLSSLMAGDYRSARAVCTDLGRRADRIAEEVDAADWDVVRAAMEIWGGCQGISIPQLDAGYLKRATDGPAPMLRECARAWRALMAGERHDVGTERRAIAMAGSMTAAKVDVPALLRALMTLLDRALHESSVGAAGEIAELDRAVELLGRRGLVALATRARMVAATLRLMSGQPIADERAFTDAGTMAIRESDLTGQLFCLAAEGWRNLTLGQVDNARFRAQQVLKLADGGLAFLRGWAMLLERASDVRAGMLMGLRAEAEMVEMGERAPSAAEAWSTALLLSGARFEPDLSVWFSIHRELMIDRWYCPVARLAMHVVGDRANVLRSVIPGEISASYLLPGDGAHGRVERVLETLGGMIESGHDAHVGIDLFGGFTASRNGHVLIDELWRRKRSGVLAARLSLTLGAFVTRQVIMEEMWPSCDYKHARSNLYSSLSSLRRALRQQQDGPQYVITQGDGVALNSEFVTSDTMRFNRLARDVMLRRPGDSHREVIEACLKLEQVYQGPLYVPEAGDVAFFLQMRKAFRARFVDCMVCGVEAALQERDTTAASWIVEAAIKAEPTREDVVRYAMKVYSECGRRREVVEVYNAHVHFLRDSLSSVPEEDTRALYEDLVGEGARTAYL